MGRLTTGCSGWRCAPPLNRSVEAVEKPLLDEFLDKEMARIFAPFCFSHLTD